MIRYNLTFDAGSQMDLSAGINAQVLPLMNQAVRAIAQATASDWQEGVMRARLWSGEKDAYVKTIKWEMTGDFSAMVSSDYKYVEDIENGRPPRDLKQMLNTSNKVRRTKDGRRFLVIPMRHNTPGQSGLASPMSAAVGRLAGAMAPSRILSTGQRPSGERTRLSPGGGMSPMRKQTPFLSNISTKQAQTVSSRNVAWGDRLSRSALKKAGADYTEQRRYAGMVRMETKLPGGKKSSAFLTFRIMMEGGKGWVIPAQPGQHIAQKVSTAMQPKADAAFAAALAKTLKG